MAEKGMLKDPMKIKTRNYWDKQSRVQSMARFKRDCEAMDGRWLGERSEKGDSTREFMCQIEGVKEVEFFEYIARNNYDFQLTSKYNDIKRERKKLDELKETLKHPPTSASDLGEKDIKQMIAEKDEKIIEMAMDYNSFAEYNSAIKKNVKNDAYGMMAIKLADIGSRRRKKTLVAVSIGVIGDEDGLHLHLNGEKIKFNNSAYYNSYNFSNYDSIYGKEKDIEALVNPRNEINPTTSSTSAIKFEKPKRCIVTASGINMTSSAYDRQFQSAYVPYEDLWKVKYNPLGIPIRTFRVDCVL